MFPMFALAIRRLAVSGGTGRGMAQAEAKRAGFMFGTLAERTLVGQRFILESTATFTPPR
jgi:hypothetical protein